MYIIGLNGREIDAVKVLALRPVQFIPELPHDAEIITNGRFEYHVLGQAVCDDEQASAIIKLWNNLPVSDQDHCHNPGFALQFILKNEVVLTAALCWGCNNISMSGRLAAIDWRLFNGRSDISIQLFRLCGDVVGYIYG